MTRCSVVRLMCFWPGPLYATYGPPRPPSCLIVDSRWSVLCIGLVRSRPEATSAWVIFCELDYAHSCDGQGGPSHPGHGLRPAVGTLGLLACSTACVCLMC